MNKLNFTLNATWIIIILLSTLPVYGMESSFVKTMADRDQISNFKLEDELIFACCQVPEVKPTELTKLEASKKALRDTIKNFMKMQITCKKYYESLTFEKIGNFCKSHSSFARNQTILNLILVYGKECPRIYNISPKEYSFYRSPMLILIHAIDNKKDNRLMETNMLWFKRAIDKNDAYMLDTLFKYQMIDPNVREGNGSSVCLPLFFYAKTVEIAQIFINNGVDIHATPGNPTYNVLTHIKEHTKYSSALEYPSELREFYLNYGVKELRLQ